MPSKFSVRKASHQDLDTVIRFNSALARETEDKVLDPMVLAQGVQKALEDPSLCTYFMAEANGEPVGQTMITYEWSDWRNGLFWWIQSVYVAKQFRRQGVFRALYAHIRALGRKEPDVCGLRLYVIRGNERAIATYRELGMTVSEYLLCEEDWTPGTA